MSQQPLVMSQGATPPVRSRGRTHCRKLKLQILAARCKQRDEPGAPEPLYLQCMLLCRPGKEQTNKQTNGILRQQSALLARGGKFFPRPGVWNMRALRGPGAGRRRASATVRFQPACTHSIIVTDATVGRSQGKEPTSLPTCSRVRRLLIGPP